MDSLFRNFLTNKALFFNLFDSATKNMVEMATLLVTIVNTDNFDKREPFFKQITRLEHDNDDITHKIYLCLDKIMFTPLNRGNIHELASGIDDVADHIHEASNRIYLYDISDITPPIIDIAGVILKAAGEIEKAIRLLRASKNAALINEACANVKIYERQSDGIYYNALAELFANEKDAVRLLKYREILSSLETSVNKCKCVTQSLSSILVNK